MLKLRNLLFFQWAVFEFEIVRKTFLSDYETVSCRFLQFFFGSPFSCNFILDLVTLSIMAPTHHHYGSDRSSPRLRSIITTAPTHHHHRSELDNYRSIWIVHTQKIFKMVHTDQFFWIDVERKASIHTISSSTDTK